MGQARWECWRSASVQWLEDILQQMNKERKKVSVLHKVCTKSCWWLLYVIVCVKQTCCPENLGWPDPYPPPSLRHGRCVYWCPPLPPPLGTHPQLPRWRPGVSKKRRLVHCSVWKFPPKDSQEYVFFGVVPAANSCHCVQHVHLAGAAPALTRYPCILRDTHHQFSKNFTFKETVTVDATCDELWRMWIRKNKVEFESKESDKEIESLRTNPPPSSRVDFLSASSICRVNYN